MRPGGNIRSHCVCALAVASVEARGIARSHPFRLFLPVGALLVLLAPGLVLFAFDQRDAMVAELGVSTAALFATLTGLAAGAGSLSGDRDTRRLDLILARTARPGAVLLGKWLGIAGMVAVSVAVIGGIHLLSLAIGGGAPAGAGPLVAALLAAAVGGALAGAVALVFSTASKPGTAFLAALLVFLAGHGVALAGDALPIRIATLLLPRAPELNLAADAAFGDLSGAAVLLAVAHGLACSLFALAAGTILLDLRSGSRAGKNAEASPKT